MGISTTQLSNAINLFGDTIVTASICNIIGAITHLSPVEFRMWADNCKTCSNIHFTHFAGLEKQYIETGEWGWKDGDPQAEPAAPLEPERQSWPVLMLYKNSVDATLEHEDFSGIKLSMNQWPEEARTEFYERVAGRIAETYQEGVPLEEIRKAVVLAETETQSIQNYHESKKRKGGE